MHPKNFALVGGFVMLVVGGLSLFPDLSQSPALSVPPLHIDTSYGLFLGIFPMNIFNKMALIVFGLAGIMTARSLELRDSINYARTVFFVMGTLAILGMFPQYNVNTLFGYWPLFGAEVLAHGILAVLGGYFGFALTVKSVQRSATAHR